MNTSQRRDKSNEKLYTSLRLRQGSNDSVARRAAAAPSSGGPPAGSGGGAGGAGPAIA